MSSTQPTLSTSRIDLIFNRFQIRDDFANLLSAEYEKNEEATEGKNFSFPVIYVVSSNLQNTQLTNKLENTFI
jgi:hypothetical protein